MARLWTALISRGRTRRRTWGLAAAVCAVALGGCAKSPYELAEVSGTVTIDGQAFTQGKVMFAPIATGEARKSGRPAFGRVDADGKYTLSTYEEGDGAVVGEHWVTIIRIEPEDEAPAPVALGGAPPFSRVAVPTKVTIVGDQENRIDIALTRQDVAQFGMFDD